MKEYDFEKAKDIFLKVCQELDIKVTENGTGQFLMDGKPFDPIEELKKELELV